VACVGPQRKKNTQFTNVDAAADRELESCALESVQGWSKQKTLVI